MTEQQPLFSLNADTPPWQWVLTPELHISVWHEYLTESDKIGVWATLRKYLPQLQFPIQVGMSQSDLYQSVTKRGLTTFKLDTYLALQRPDVLRLFISEGVAGLIPVIQTSERADFVALVQALAKRNEPTPIPDSMGACLISGYNNWDRIRRYREEWIANQLTTSSGFDWAREFSQLIQQKRLYQDQFLILYGAFYSDTPAWAMSMAPQTWQTLSLKIRLAHESTHYFTKRVFGIIRRHLFDELLADYAGIVAAYGQYRADWFLRFMGLEAYPQYREGGRLQNYIDDFDPQSEVFALTKRQIKEAAENLEQFDQQIDPAYRDRQGQALILLTICCFTLSDLARKMAPSQLVQTLALVKQHAKFVYEEE